MGKRQIWHLAQSEPNAIAIPDTKCVGTPLGDNPINTQSPDQVAFPAEYNYPFGTGGHRLVSYVIDEEFSGFLTGKLLADKLKVTSDEGLSDPELTFSISFGADGDFENLCLFYDAEGGPNLNVAAWVIDLDKPADPGHPLRPVIPAGKTLDGTSPQCPIAKVVERKAIDDNAGVDYPLDAWLWSDTAFTRWLPPHEQPGAWHTEPAESVGFLEFHARKTLTIPPHAATEPFPTKVDAKTYEFVGWEFGSLNSTLVDRGPVEDAPYTFHGATYAGLIAYYTLAKPLVPGKIDDAIPSDIPWYEWRQRVLAPILRVVRAIVGRAARRR